MLESKNNEVTVEKIESIFGEFPKTVNIFIFKDLENKGLGIGLKEHHTSLKQGEDVNFGDTRLFFAPGMVGTSLGVERYETAEDLYEAFELYKNLWEV